MEKDLNFVHKLSLEELCVRKVVANVWIKIDTLPEFQEIPFKWSSEDGGEGKWRELCKEKHKINKEWLEAVEKIKTKVTNLVIPEALKNRMLHLVKPVGIDISRWKTFHEKFLCKPREDFDRQMLEHLCWTFAGNIDFRKTAEKLVRLETLDVVKRFRLACTYCLEDYIPILWKKLPNKYKRRFNSETGRYLIIVIPLEFYWAYVLKGEESKLDYILQSPSPFRRYAFQFSARKGNRAATEYFFQKLTHKERDSALCDTALIVVEERCENSSKVLWDFPKEKLFDVLCYLLSVMTPEQQMSVLKQQPCGVLKCFLDWPYQDFFLDMADIIWTFLPANQYGNLQWKMIESFRNSDYYLPNFFQQFFLRSPGSFRKDFISRECRFGSFFTEFFNVEDTETIELVFRNIDTEDRWRFVSCYWFFTYFIHSNNGKKLHLAKLCLQEACLSQQERMRLKDIFSIFLPDTLSVPEIIREKKLQLLVDSLDKSEDETSPKAKKFRREEGNKLDTKTNPVSNVSLENTFEIGIVLALKEIQKFNRINYGMECDDYE